MTSFAFQIGSGHVALSGNLDFNAHPQWRRLIQSLSQAQGDEAVTLDMAGVTMVDAAGLGLLLITHDTLTAQKAGLALRNPSPEVRRVLEVSGFAEMVEIRG